MWEIPICKLNLLLGGAFCVGNSYLRRFVWEIPIYKSNLLLGGAFCVGNSYLQTRLERFVWEILICNLNWLYLFEPSFRFLPGEVRDRVYHPIPLFNQWPKSPAVSTGPVSDRYPERGSGSRYVLRRLTGRRWYARTSNASGIPEKCDHERIRQRQT